MPDEFSHTPFAHIVQTITLKNPKKIQKKRIQTPCAVHKHSQNPAQNTQDTDESILFLESVYSMRFCEQAKQSSFSLAERTSLHQCLTQHGAKKDEEKQKIRSPQAEQDTQNTNTENIFVDTEGCDFIQAMQTLKGVSPLTQKGRDIAPAVTAQCPTTETQDLFHNALERIPEFSLALKGEYLEGYVVGLDENIMHSLRSGFYSPEAHLDLHGLNAVQAYHALVGFFRSAWYKGLRTTLIVPGRGKNSLNGFGVLRDKLQFWLTQDPFKRVVLAFCTARPVDGGAGSVYVLLRKYSKKRGKIAWNRMPADPDLF